MTLDNTPPRTRFDDDDFLDNGEIANAINSRVTHPWKRFDERSSQSRYFLLVCFPLGLEIMGPEIFYPRVCVTCWPILHLCCLH